MAEIHRLPDWPVRLHDYVDRVKRLQFDWGEHNCATFTAGAVEAMTGVNLAAEYGDFHTREGALSVLRCRKLKTLADLAALHLPEVAVSRASIGDVVAIEFDSEFGCVLGVVNGETVLVLRPEGMGISFLTDAYRAFKV